MMYRVLLIDDDPVFASLVKAIGVDYGLEFDAHESLSDLGTVAFLGDYDGALLDYYLPEVNGFEIAEYYQQFFSKIPVIMVSASNLDPSLAWPPCVNHLLCKSAGIVQIVEATAQILNQAVRNRQLDGPVDDIQLDPQLSTMANKPNSDRPRIRYFPA